MYAENHKCIFVLVFSLSVIEAPLFLLSFYRWKGAETGCFRLDKTPATFMTSALVSLTGVMVHYNVLSNEEKNSTLLGQRRTWLRNLGKVVRPLSGIVSLPFVMQTQKLLEFFTVMKG